MPPNPLVNAMCVGLLPPGGLVRAAAESPGSVLMVAGSATGRDGIHGASGLASRAFEEEREMRPTVQVGDPFLEKVLIEACLEAAAAGLLDGLQDLGAAGLTSAAIECAARGGTGIEIDVARVPQREPGMSAYEVMLSESQERMLLIVGPERVGAVTDLFARWDLPVTAVGRVTDDRRVRIVDGREPVAEVGVDVLVDAPQYPAPRARGPPTWTVCRPPPCRPRRRGERAGGILLALLASPNVASRRAVYRRFDHEVQTRTVVRPGAGDAAVLRLREAETGIAMAVDGNGRLAYLDPYVGGAMAVAEACRNVAVSGATPLGVTDCLNFGDPQKPEVYYQLEECVRGMADACRALDAPVVSGNVSLYNETQGEAVYPTPVVGAVGLLASVADRVGAGFAGAGDPVLLLGASVRAPEESLAGSEYLALEHGLVAGRPSIDLDAEARLQRLLVGLARARCVHSAHDCSDGGLAVALAESAALGGVGFVGAGDWTRGRWDAALFGEAPSRAVVSCAPADAGTIARMAREAGVPCARLGTTGGERFVIPPLVDEALSALHGAFFGGLEQALIG